MKWLLIFFFVAFSSCDLTNFSRQYSIASPEEISDISVDEYFFINIKDAYSKKTGDDFDPIDFIMYAMDEGPGTDCKIPVNAGSSTEDLFCIFDIMEGDLWYNEITFEYNAPPGMCDYLGFLPHWHYNYESGVGPPIITQYLSNNNNNSTGDMLYIGCKHERYVRHTEGVCSNDSCPKNKTACENAEHTCNRGTCSNNRPCQNKTACEDPENPCNRGHEGRGTWTEGKEGTWTTWSTCHPDGQVKDEYGDPIIAKTPEGTCNYKANDILCCFGEYDSYSDGGIDGRRKKWGTEGQVDKSCIGGLARENKDKNKFGFPTTTVVKTGSRNKTGEFKIKPIDDTVEEASSLPTANFFKAIEDDKEVDMPKFYTISSGSLYNGHPYITVSCLDHAKEVKHRINLLIREWNTQEEFISFKEGGRGDPDAGEGGVKNEGSDCEYYEKSRMVFGDCNDLEDADNNGDSYPQLTYKGDSSKSGGDNSD